MNETINRLEFDKEEFIHTAFGGSVMNGLYYWDKYKTEKSQYEMGSKEYTHFSNSADRKEEGLYMAIFAIMTCYGISCTLARNEHRYGIVDKESGEWLIEVDRETAL
jgi:hypothetical protein